ncbi:ATP-binding protein [Roseiconus lacunae]|uniref:ATP-binding protein n=1 Tax=Roseiconus lacunae TaxID=2605694 RepID=UPI001E60247D|nr:ATP-binding protein [Roseiconus lacunae]MCD0460561.1 Hpt domain-containing protein [Roseiconus lacunae]
MSQSSLKIERNVKTIATLGAFVLASLIVTVCVVQHTLGKSIKQLSTSVIPMQSKLAELNEAVGRMFLSQSNLHTLDQTQIEALENDKQDEHAALKSLAQLKQQLTDPVIVSAKHFPTDATSNLDSEVEQFLDARKKLFHVAKLTESLEQEFKRAQDQVDADLKHLLQETAAIAGILRLKYVLEMRQVAHDLDHEITDQSHLRDLIVGDTRAQSEAIEAFNLSAQKLNSLAGKISAAGNTDILNSLSANEAAQNSLKLRKSLEKIERVLTDDQYQDRLAKLNQLTNMLIERVDDSNESLAAKRREILLRRQELRQIQNESERSAHILQRCTSSLLAFSERFATETSGTAENTISGSRAATAFIVIIGLLCMIIAAFRVRTSVFDLRSQNERLSELSQSLAEANSGLELAVKQRTASLQLVLDSTGDGIFTVDTDGLILPERSKAVVEWFGEPRENAKLWEYLAGDDDNLSDEFWMGFDQIVSEIFPFEVAAAQAPSRLTLDGRTYELEYREVSSNGTLNRVLVIVKDITAHLEAERADRAIKELQEVIGNLLRDRDGFCDSIRECNKLIESVGTTDDMIFSKRIIHTIKGNCAIIGFRSISDQIHELESILEDDNRLPSDEEVASLNLSWNQGLSRMGTFLDTCDQGIIHVMRSDLERLANLLRNEAGYDDILPLVEQCLLEPVNIQLNRLADHAARIATVLDKKIHVTTDDGGLSLPAERLKSFWPTMIHLVRNAVDHGLESSEERLTAGKSEAGQLWLSSDVVNGWMEISLSDDGRGLDWERIREKATSLGLPADRREDLLEAMFTDGFSTRSEATDLSGRGVGLSAVKAACEMLGGSISVQSDRDHGTEFTIRFPWEKGIQLDTPRQSHLDSATQSIATPTQADV